ncbi:hypothetical protein NDU88_005612 [Pleurodeles waltl]|uniref:Uncharacterized protein n=1 Tax=Pleurodeles waltl TaxID=8319 RepID=A0AAV7TVB7_PLEWA|nr:hypothetical protein NDU88_005612 [Pleurodeles waltl]
MLGAAEEKRAYAEGVGGLARLAALTRECCGSRLWAPYAESERSLSLCGWISWDELDGPWGSPGVLSEPLQAAYEGTHTENTDTRQMQGPLHLRCVRLQVFAFPVDQEILEDAPFQDIT